MLYLIANMTGEVGSHNVTMAAFRRSHVSNLISPSQALSYRQERASAAPGCPLLRRTSCCGLAERPHPSLGIGL